MGKVKISDRFTGKSGVSAPSVKRALARNKATGSVNYGMFVDESEQDNQIYITLNNASETDTKRIVLFAGNLTTLDEVKKVAGLSNADAIAAEGKIATDVTVVAPNLSYTQRSICYCPQRVGRLQISANNDAQLNNVVDIARFGIAGKKESDTLMPGSYVQANDQKTLVNIPFDHFQLDHRTAIMVTLNPKSSLNLTFFLGSRFDLATFCEESSEAALD